MEAEPIKAPACAAPTYAERTNRLERLAEVLPRLAPAMGEGPILEGGIARLEPFDLPPDLEAARVQAALDVLKAISAIAREDG